MISESVGEPVFAWKAGFPTVTPPRPRPSPATAWMTTVTGRWTNRIWWMGPISHCAATTTPAPATSAWGRRAASTKSWGAATALTRTPAPSRTTATGANASATRSSATMRIPALTTSAPTPEVASIPRWAALATTTTRAQWVTSVRRLIAWGPRFHVTVRRTRTAKSWRTVTSATEPSSVTKVPCPISAAWRRRHWWTVRRLRDWGPSA